MAIRDPEVQEEVDIKVNAQVKALNQMMKEDHGKDKRDLGITAAVVGISMLVGGIIGGASVYGITTISGGTSTAIVQDLDQTEAALNDHAALINRAIKMARLAHEDVDRIHLDLPEHYEVTATEAAVVCAIRTVERLQRAYQEAMNGKMPLDLVATEGIGTTLRKLRKRVAAQGDELLITAPVELHQCPTSIAANSTTLILVTEVPVVTKEAEPLQVYQLVNTPMRINGEWVTIAPGPRDVIMVNHDRTRFRTLSRADLSVCKPFGTAFVCEHANVLTKADSGPETIGGLLPPPLDQGGLRQDQRLLPSQHQPGLQPVATAQPERVRLHEPGGDPSPHQVSGAGPAGSPTPTRGPIHDGSWMHGRDRHTRGTGHLRRGRVLLGGLPVPLVGPRKTGTTAQSPARHHPPQREQLAISMRRSKRTSRDWMRTRRSRPRCISRTPRPNPCPSGTSSRGGSEP